MGKHSSAKATKAFWTPRTIAAVGAMVIGALIMVYPSVAGWLNNRTQQNDSVAYEQAINNDLTREEVAQIRDRAVVYNDNLVPLSKGYVMTEEDIEAYNEVLDPADNGMMGYVTIPALDVEVPIYHGSSDEIMRMGAGHIEGTSMPVGGPSTHAAITAHRGEPGSDYFLHLDKLAEGDTFSVTVLGETLTYEVDKISVVEPDDVSELAIVEGEDLFTLLTCTPVTLNTHRLLVRGHRV